MTDPLSELFRLVLECELSAKNCEYMGPRLGGKLEHDCLLTARIWRQAQRRVEDALWRLADPAPVVTDRIVGGCYSREAPRSCEVMP